MWSLGSQDEATRIMPRRIEVVFLGTGAAVPTLERYTSSILIRDWHGRMFLLDAGEGVQRRIMEIGMSINDIDYIMLTHSHGDHINGVAGLLQSMSLQGRRRPITIVGSEDSVFFVREVLEAEKQLLGYEVLYLTISNGAIFGETILDSKSGDKLVLSWYKTCHTKDSYGFVLKWLMRPRIAGHIENISPLDWKRLIKTIQTKHGYTQFKISYTGDTKPCPTIVEASKKASLLIHDSTFTSEYSKEAHDRGHSTSTDSAKAAIEANVDVLVLTHISSRYRGFEARRLLEEARRIFPKTILARDKMRLLFEPPIREVDLSQTKVFLEQ